MYSLAATVILIAGISLCSISAVPVSDCLDNQGQVREMTAAKEWRYISSQNSLDSYPNIVNCSWRIRTANQLDVVYVEVMSSFLGSTVNCARDYVKVFDGGTLHDKSFGKWCGNATPSYVSTSNIISIQFYTEETVQKRSFQLKFKANSPPTDKPNGKSDTFMLPMLTFMGVTAVSVVFSCLFAWYFVRKTKTRLGHHTNPVSVSQTSQSVQTISPETDDDYTLITGRHGRNTLTFSVSEPPPAYSKSTDGNHKTATA